MDDMLVLIKTQKQYRRARKILFQTLRTLQLALSPKKTKMGRLNEFHFLGILFRVSQNREKQIQLSVQLHARTCTRSLDKVKAMANKPYRSSGNTPTLPYAMGPLVVGDHPPKLASSVI